MPKVLIVATSSRTHGGIASVIKAHRMTAVWNIYHCKWIAVHRDGSKLRKIVYLLTGILRVAAVMPFYDIVHIHMSAGISAKRKIIFVKMAKLLGKGVVVHMHCGTQIEKEWSSQMNYIFTKANRSLMLAEKIKNAVASHIGKTDNLEVCYNPAPQVDIATLPLARKKQILYSGTIGFNKGYHTLLKAFSRIASRYPDWTISIAGVGETDKCMELIQQLGITGQVRLMGWVDGLNKENLFRESSIFCLPSYMEGFPMAVLEAWAYGIPVIATPVGGIPDVAVDGENILLFEPGDDKELSKLIASLIDNEELRSKLSNKSIELANNKFALETIATQLDRIYTQVYNSK